MLAKHQGTLNVQRCFLHGCEISNGISVDLVCPASLGDSFGNRSYSYIASFLKFEGNFCSGPCSNR